MGCPFWIGDHPRGCGEKAPLTGITIPLWGSSPRVRGEGSMSAAMTRWRGIIPAGAGRSNHVHFWIPFVGDHPRGCGEKSMSCWAGRPGTGSSPRVRGEGGQLFERTLQPGIIPAGAGRSFCSASWVAWTWDHPRGCGEKHTFYRAGRPRKGSSPRVRGEGVRVTGVGARPGIIPAGAGRRDGEGGFEAFGGDHPRGCGEKSRSSSVRVSEMGSSPRVRGEGLCLRRGRLWLGIIPAGAGRSVKWCFGAVSHRDHPRGCGEKAGLSGMVSSRAGSSPRVRGEVKRTTREW